MATRNRIDAHRPAEMIPGNYQYLASSFPVPSEDPETGREITHIEWDGSDEWEAMGRPVSSTCQHAVSGQCDHCGAHHTYQTILLYLPTQEILSVGHTCANTRFGRTDWKNVIADGARRAELKAKRAANEAKALAAMSEEEKVAYDWGKSDKSAHHIAQEMAGNVQAWGPLSEKQAAFLVKLHREAREVKQKIEDKVILPCPAGRVTVVGKVLTTKLQESMFGSTLKMLVEAADGWKVWGTVPASISAYKGDTVEFVATLEPKADEPTFGYYTRPSKAKVLEAAA